MSLLSDLQKRREADNVAIAAARNRLPAWQSAVFAVSKRIPLLLEDLQRGGFVKFQYDSIHQIDPICKERYETSRLTLLFDRRRVVIATIDEYCLGNDGRMDITVDNGIKQYALVWMKLAGKSAADEHWFIAPVEMGGMVGQRNPLSKESLEAAARSDRNLGTTRSSSRQSSRGPSQGATWRLEL